VPYSALEAFEADNRSRMYYKVSGFDGEMVSGFDDLPPPARPHARPAASTPRWCTSTTTLPRRAGAHGGAAAAGGRRGGQGMATIQVAETLELRETLARQLLLDTLWRRPRCWR
jgi:two-component system, OmpR family, sensor histidine kinase TctE